MVCEKRFSSTENQSYPPRPWTKVARVGGWTEHLRGSFTGARVDLKGVKAKSSFFTLNDFSHVTVDVQDEMTGYLRSIPLVCSSRRRRRMAKYFIGYSTLVYSGNPVNKLEIEGNSRAIKAI